MMPRRRSYKRGFPNSETTSCLSDFLTLAVYLIHVNRTLHESKGLEFNDVSFGFIRTCLTTDQTKVILYNFFEDSTTAFNQWRLVLNEVPHEDRLQDAPTFDETRHASICVEVRCFRYSIFSFCPHLCRLGRQLKFLYVAITRARQNLWIVDNSEKAEPMKVPESFVSHFSFHF